MTLPLLIALSLPAAYAQAVHNVTVGLVGSFYDPQTVSAAENDVVNFIFSGVLHDVIEGRFDSPCTPVPGGFNSGPLGRGIDLSGPTQMWSLTVTNASAPIWLFCSMTVPTIHCASGMVGAINPPSQDAFLQYSNAAKSVTQTPVVTRTLVQHGVAATGGTPTTLPLAQAPSLSSTPLSTAASQTTTSPAKQNHTSSIVGGVVGGVVGAAFLVIIGALWCFKRRKQSRTGDSQKPKLLFARNAGDLDDIAGSPATSHGITPFDPEERHGTNVPMIQNQGVNPTMMSGKAQHQASFDLAKHSPKSPPMILHSHTDSDSGRGVRMQVVRNENKRFTNQPGGNFNRDPAAPAPPPY